MELKQKGVAGTLESGDILIELEQTDNSGIQVNLSSKVLHQFGKQITQVIKDTLLANGIENAVVNAQDQGSLDCTIRARVTTAIYRGCQSTDYKWN